MLQLKVGQRVRVAGIGLSGSGSADSDLTGTVVAVDVVRQWVAVTFEGVAGHPTVLLPSTKVQPVEADVAETGAVTFEPAEVGRLEFCRWLVQHDKLSG